MNMVGSVDRCSNGNVITFDRMGEQMCELQGRFEDVKDKILEHSDDQTEFYLTDWQQQIRLRVNRTRWSQAAWKIPESLQ